MRVSAVSLNVRGYRNTGISQTRNFRVAQTWRLGGSRSGRGGLSFGEARFALSLSRTAGLAVFVLKTVRFIYRLTGWGRSGYFRTERFFKMEEMHGTRN